MAKYYLYKLFGDFNIPGDWEWYLETLENHHRMTDGRYRWRTDIDNIDIHVYDMPKGIDAYTINWINFEQYLAVRYSGTRPSTPTGVLPGVVTCMKRAFLERIDPLVVKKYFITGRMLQRNKGEIEDWVPVLSRRKLDIPLADWNSHGVKIYEQLLLGEEIYSSTWHNLILREDIFERVKDIKIKECKIQEWPLKTKGKYATPAAAQEVSSDPAMNLVREAFKESAEKTKDMNRVDALKAAGEMMKARLRNPEDPLTKAVHLKLGKLPNKQDEAKD
jgi:hypothetical protein